MRNEDISVQFVSNVRGFFKHLIDSKIPGIKFLSKKETYEVPSRLHKIASKVVRSRIGDVLGLVQVVEPKSNDATVIGSFNRFVDSEKPYFIYLENPTALYHYSLGRNKTLLGRRRISKAVNNINLKSVVCMSRACFENLKIDNETLFDKSKVIYPLVPRNDFVDESIMEKRVKSRKFQMLFITQGQRFISKGGPEVIEIMERLKDNNNITLKLITEKKYIPRDILKRINDLESIELCDFGYSYEQMQKIYSNANLLIHLTSDDSFGLTILEAMKAGLPVISTNLYAVPEMVRDGYNGFLHDPKWNFFSKDKLPNPKVWNHRKSTLYNPNVDENIVDYAVKKILILTSDKSKQLEMSLNSFQMANRAPFGADYIKQQWKNEFKRLVDEEK